MGETKLWLDDLSEGDEAPALTHTLSRADLVEYAGASGDFNPLHTDEVAAQDAGMPSVFGHGMFSAGLLATAITNWVGIGNLTSYRVRFVKQTWPGEALTTRIKVTSTRLEKGVGTIDLDCSLANDAGEVKVAGTATASVPARP